MLAPARLGRRYAAISSANEPPEGDLGEDAQKMLADLVALSRSLAKIEARTGRKAPSVAT